MSLGFTAWGPLLKSHYGERDIKPPKCTALIVREDMGDLRPRVPLPRAIVVRRKAKL